MEAALESAHQHLLSDNEGVPGALFPVLVRTKAVADYNIIKCKLLLKLDHVKSLTLNKTEVEGERQWEEGKRTEFLSPHALKLRAHYLTFICQITETEKLVSSFPDNHHKSKQKELKVAAAKG